MSHNKVLSLVAVIVLLFIVANGAVYTVSEGQKAVVTRFGQVISYNDQPGLHFKTPFVETVQYFDGRVQTLDTEPETFLTIEKKSVVVDSYVKWRISNLLKFYVAVGGNALQARERLAQVVNSGLRNEFGKRTVQEVIAGDRSKIMRSITADTNRRAAEYGIQVIDVRIDRIDLPKQVSESVYQRMRAERTRIAKALRADGAEAAEKIRAAADRQREIILADAYRQAQRIRGEGDARAAEIYARAYRVNPRFYAFYGSMNAYRKSFSSKHDVMVVDPSATFFKYLKNPQQ
ncbi:MAG: protease modulator HflC [Gammaproteobacteria bacterium]|nr:protease modulator HflC [Gammaproteobacteria bacterium]